MKELLEYLKIKDGKTYYINEIQCYFYNFNEDKLIIAIKTVELNDVSNLVAGLLEELQNLRKNITNEKNLINQSILNEADLSMFLWDLYVVCFYNTNELTSEDKEKIYKLEKNKYIARKIVLPYTENDLPELKEKYNKYVFPETYLNKIKEDEYKKRIKSEYENNYEDYIREINEIKNFLIIEGE